MKITFLFIVFTSTVGLFLPFSGLAHSTGVTHEEPEEELAQVSPAVAGGVFGAVALGGFALWWFVLRKK